MYSHLTYSCFITFVRIENCQTIAHRGLRFKPPVRTPTTKLELLSIFLSVNFLKRKKHGEFQLPSIRKQESIYVNQYVVTHPTGSGNTQYTSISDSLIELGRLYGHRILYILERPFIRKGWSYILKIYRSRHKFSIQQNTKIYWKIRICPLESVFRANLHQGWRTIWINLQGGHPGTRVVTGHISLPMFSKFD